MRIEPLSAPKIKPSELLFSYSTIRGCGVLTTKRDKSAKGRKQRDSEGPLGYPGKRRGAPATAYFRPRRGSSGRLFRSTFVRVSAYETNRSGSLNKPFLTLSFCSGNAGLDISSCRKILNFDGGRWRNQTISVEISGFVKVAIQISRPGRQESKRLGDGRKACKRVISN